jgi:hypothetical protein
LADWTAGNLDAGKIMSKIDEQFVEQSIAGWYGFTPAKESVSGLAGALTQMSDAIEKVSEKEDLSDSAAEPSSFQLVMDRLGVPTARR